MRMLWDRNSFLYGCWTVRTRIWDFYTVASSYSTWSSCLKNKTFQQHAKVRVGGRKGSPGSNYIVLFLVSFFCLWIFHSILSNIWIHKVLLCLRQCESSTKERTLTIQLSCKLSPRTRRRRLVKSWDVWDREEVGMGQSYLGTTG